MFLLKEPTVAEIRNYITYQSRKNFCYRDKGATRNCSPPREFVTHHYRVQLGSGDLIWQRARKAIQTWRMFSTDWTRLCWSYKRIEPGTIVGVLATHYGFWSLNATRIIYVLDEETPRPRYGFAYGTVGSHALAGEERFLVERLEDDSVWYDLYSFSMPRHWAARYGYPILRRLQKRFARDSVKAMATAVKTAVQSQPDEEEAKYE